MLTPDKVTEKFLSIGKTKTTLPLWKMFLLGLAAGIYIAPSQVM